MNPRTPPWHPLAILLILLGMSRVAVSILPHSQPGMISPARESLATPTYDPLATPVLPENPTQEQIGQQVYYYHCMPCHGDRGQGLTDEWRLVWEEDHQNCWARGCHVGRSEDEGFPIPTIIPAVILDRDSWQRFKDAESLYQYLMATHPPQSPGALLEEQYQALAAYLWAANGLGGSDVIAGPTPAITELPNTPDSRLAISFGVIGMAAVLFLGVTAVWLRHKKAAS